MITVKFEDEPLFKLMQDAVRSVLSETIPQPAASSDGQQLLTRKESATLAGVCLATIDNKVRDGVLQRYRTGGIVRFKKQEVIDAFSQSMFHKSTRAANARGKKA